MIQLKNISRSYQTQYERVEALKHINLTLGPSGLVFITGKSGSGKSTLLNLIGGLDQADQGSIHVFGYELEKFSLSELDAYRNTTLGFVFQEFNLLTDFTVYDNIAIVLKLQGKEVDPIEISDVLKAVDLEGYEKRYIYQLSGGQKQRVAIARAFIKKPKLMIADEPTGSLDSETGDEVFKILKKLSKDCLVIVVSHDKEQAITYGDRIIELKDGKVLNDSASIKPMGNPKTLSHDTLIYSKYSFFSAVKFASKIMFKHSIRLTISIILIAISLVFLGFMHVITSYSEDTVYVEGYLNKKILFTTVKESYSFSNMLGHTLNEPTFISKQTLAYLSTQYHQNSYKEIYSPRNNTSFSSYLYHPIVDSNDLSYYTSNLYGIMDITSNELSNYGYTLIEGVMPVLPDEALISKYTYQSFDKFGYRDENQLIPILSYSDIIGKTISYGGIEVRISGIIDTKLNDELYEKIHDENIENRVKDVLVNQLNNMRTLGPHALLFVSSALKARYIEESSLYIEDSHTLMEINMPDDYKLRINQVKTLDQLNLYTYTLKDINLDNEDNDFLVLPLSTIEGAYGIFVDGTISVNINTYLQNEENITLDNIRSALIHYQSLLEIEEVKEISEWSETDKTIYRSYYQSLLTIMDQLNIDNPYGASYQALRRQILISVINSLEPSMFEVSFIYDSDTVAYQQTNLEIIGFYDDRDEQSLTAYTTEQTITGFNLISNTIYDRVILFTNGLNKDSLLSIKHIQNGAPIYKAYKITDEMIDYASTSTQNVKNLVEILSGTIWITTLLSILLMFNFISVSVYSKKHEIGVLRSLGTKTFDITKIFMIEGLLIAIISTLISYIGIYYFTYLVNQGFQTPEIYVLDLFYVQIFTLLYMVIFSMITAFIACFIPIFKISRMKVIDALSLK